MPMLDDWMTFVCDGCREVYAGSPEFTERDMTFCCETCWDTTKHAKPDGVPCEMFVSQHECMVAGFIADHAVAADLFRGCRFDAEGGVKRNSVLYCPWRRLAAGSEFAELAKKPNEPESNITARG